MRRSESVIHPDLFQYHNHFEFLGMIGATKLSEVFKVRHRQTGEIFAVKRSRKRFRTKLQRERCLREIKAVAALPSHANIVAQYRAWQEASSFERIIPLPANGVVSSHFNFNGLRVCLPCSFILQAGHFYIQMDYCEGGSLHDRIYNTSAAPMTDDEVWHVALHVASGLHFLHSNNVLHLDIKPENFYRNIDVDGMPGPWRIGDFGLAVARESKDWEEGDGDYVAPELLRSGGEPSPAADVFSLGATLYECATGKKLPRREGSAQAAEVALQGRPEALQKLVGAMLLPEPASRPLALQVAALAAVPIQEKEAMQVTPPPVRDVACCDQDDTFSFGHGVQRNYHIDHAASVPSPELGAWAFPGLGNEEDGEGGGGGLAPQQHAVEEVVVTGGLRWVPSLSPLISEGALTPGAAAGLIGLTPPSIGAYSTSSM